MALEIVLNAKLRRTGICGATESLVVDRAVTHNILPPIIDALHEQGCEIRAEQALCDQDSFLRDSPYIAAPFSTI